MDAGVFFYLVFILLQNGNGEVCTKLKQHGHYSCEGRNLTYIPTSVPSFVKILDFSFNFLPALHKSVFPWMYYLKVLDLTRCHIQYIDDDAFHNVKNVTTLILTGNPVLYIGPESLNSLHNLQKLVLVDINLLSVKFHFNNVTMLQELNFGTNKIQSMALPPFMTNFKDFSVLDLHANNISTLKASHTNVLREMRGNITLILARNPIFYIEAGAFQNIYLRELNIRSAFSSFSAQRDGLEALRGLKVDKLVLGIYRLEHWIERVNSDYLDSLCLISYKEIYLFLDIWSDSYHIFRCMDNATKISLEQGFINAMQYSQFQKLKELSIVNNNLPFVLQLSHLQTLEKLVVVGNGQVFFEGFSDMPKLQHVDLSRNKMHLFECCSQYLTGMPNIRLLNLSLNSYIHMRKNTFSGLDSLEVLDFHSTRLSGLSGHFELFENLKHLQFLDISYVDMSFRSTMTFGNLGSLKVLKVAGNYFHKDSLSYIFENLTGLELLDISNCGIEKISWRTFKSLPSLQELYLSQNKLMTLGFLTHPNLKGLKLLVANTNNIAVIPLNVLQNLPTNLSVFDVSFNPTECSCSNADFILWLNSRRDIFPHPSNILCKTLESDSIIRAIDFDTKSCVHVIRLTVVLPIVALVVIIFALVLVYKFNFFLRYGFVLLRCYRVSRQQEYSYDAFVIHSSKDESWVTDELMKNLENGTPPITLCIHGRDFKAGKAIISNIIDEGIMGSRKIIVVVSKHFTESYWCRFEFEVAQSWLVMQRNANIIIIVLEDVKEERTRKVFGLHKLLKKNTYLKWSKKPMSNVRFWIRLREAIIKKN